MKFKIFSRKEKKENPVGPSLIPMGVQSIGGAKEGVELIRAGYARNVIVYRAVREIATAAASFEFVLHKGKEEIEQHPILDLLRRPNPLNGQGSFIEELFTNWLITGEMWMSKNGPMGTKEPKELWSLSPLDMRVIPGTGGLPSKYIHKKNNVETFFPVDQISGKSDVFFLKMYDPTNYWRGMPPLRAAALAADAHNEGLNWNYNLMRKGARPSGWIKGTGGNPGPEVISRLKEWYRTTMQGSDNAGEVGIMFGGAEFVPFESNAKDMDYINGMKEFAKYVSTAFGVPIPLIDNDAATMNNMEQSKERLWTDTVIPLGKRFLDALNSWLEYFYGPGYELKIDEDCIQALEGIRQKRFDRTIKAHDGSLLTINEAREQIGFDRYNDPNADKIFVNAGRMPLEISDVGYTPPPGFDNNLDPNANLPATDPNSPDYVPPSK